MQHWPPDIAKKGANLRARGHHVRQSAWQGSCKNLKSGCRLRTSLSDGRAGRSGRGSGKFNVVLPTLHMGRD